MSVECEGLGAASFSSSPDGNTSELAINPPTILFRNGDREFSVPLPKLPFGEHYRFGRFSQRDIGEVGLHLVSFPQVAPEGWDTSTVSSSHFEIWRDPLRGTYLIKDLGSKNGTLSRIRNGEDTSAARRLDPNENYELHDMSTLKLPGFAKMIFREFPEVATSEES